MARPRRSTFVCALLSLPPMTATRWGRFTDKVFAVPILMIHSCPKSCLRDNGVHRTDPVESSFRQNFNVTGLQPITKRNVIYVVQGGALDIFDTNTDALETGITQIDIIGAAKGVVLLDP